ncbi:MAG: AsmA-like C-terminal region-containing protein [Alphaproteobacteria bacterium]|nr:AsmA-like C-terminal region-containing protein [Alphaproteobacteria bacterium]
MKFFITYKFIFNILKKLFILFSSVIALCSLALMALCIIILASKSITITDNNKYISKLMSWYFDKEVYFEEVKINNISLKEYYTFKIKNLTINKINDYQNLEVEYAKFDINIGNILNRVSKFNSIYLNNISIDYLRKDENVTNSSYVSLNNLIGITKNLHINNGRINVDIAERTYNFSKINLQKIDGKNININGSFNYKDNYFQKVDKLFTFKSLTFNGKDIINCKFEDFNINDSIVKEFVNNNNFNIKGSINGELNFNFINGLLSTIDINMTSANIFLNLTNKIIYNGIQLIKLPDIKLFELSANYNFQEDIFQINELNLNIKNNKFKDSAISISNKYSLDNKVINIKSYFKNIKLNDYIYINESKYNLDILANINGNLELFIKNNYLNSVALSINNISNSGNKFKNIKYNYDRDSKVNNLSFTLNTKYKLLKSFINKYDFYKGIQQLPIQPEDILNFDANLNMSQLFNPKNGVFGSIKGNLIFEKNIHLFNDILILNSLEYDIYFDNNKSSILGNINNNHSEINFSYLKSKTNLPKIKLDYLMSNHFINNLKFIKDFKGETLLECSIISLDHTNYDCSINLTDTSFSIPFIKYQKYLNEDALLSFNGNLNNVSKLNKINLYYINMENIIDITFNINNSNDNYNIKFHKLLSDRNNLSLDLNYDSGSYEIIIHSGSLDLDLFFGNTFSNNSPLDISVNANLDKFFIKDIIINNGNIFYQNSSKKKILSIEGKYHSDENILFNYKNTNDSNVLKYNFHASNAGKFFELLNYKSELKDGILSSEGFIGALDNDNDIMGTLSIDNFKIMKTPLFAELLLAASLTGLTEVLENDGIQFEQLDAQFTAKDNEFLISKSRAFGFSLGLTAEGNINSKEKYINLIGSIVPAYKINTLLNNIPIVGDLLTAREDEGIFAINYEAIGPWNKPNILINPLTLLTPGIIRNIFN